MSVLNMLKREWLAKLVGAASDERIRKLFGYDPKSGTITNGIEHLKLCFGHFGGEDEWLKFFEHDREVYATQLVNCPERGIVFCSQSYASGKSSKQEFIWKFVDWYSIICSLMLQHDHVMRISVIFFPCRMHTQKDGTYAGSLSIMSAGAACAIAGGR